MILLAKTAIFTPSNLTIYRRFYDTQERRVGCENLLSLFKPSLLPTEIPSLWIAAKIHLRFFHCLTWNISGLANPWLAGAYFRRTAIASICEGRSIWPRAILLAFQNLE